MKHNIIKTENYLLIVDDSEIKKGDYTYHHIKGIYTAVVDGGYTNQKKIIAHLPFNNSPILKGVDLLPPLEQEDDVEMMADEIYPETYYSGIYVDGWLKAGFIKGYNKAKEKYKWTDEDVIKIVEKSRETGLTAEYLLLTMSQPKYPIAFELELDVLETKDLGNEYSEFMKPLKKRWIGKYIY